MRRGAAFAAGPSLLDMAGEDAWLDMAIGNIASFSTWEKLQEWLVYSFPAALARLRGVADGAARAFAAVERKKIALFTAETLAGMAAATTHDQVCDAFFKLQPEWRRWPEADREALWQHFLTHPIVEGACRASQARMMQAGASA